MQKDYSDEALKKRLTPEQFHSLREKGNEYPGAGKWLYNTDKGMYVCPVCGTALFSSQAKYDSKTPGLIGWPSFSDAAASDAVELVPDNRYGWQRTEVICKTCGSHLGHLFDDADSPSGQHYCINSAALDFEREQGS